MPTTPSLIDAKRAGIMAVLNSLFPMLILLGVLDWTAEQSAGVMLFASSVVTLGFLFVPAKAPTP